MRLVSSTSPTMLAIIMAVLLLVTLPDYAGADPSYTVAQGDTAAFPSDSNPQAIDPGWYILSKNGQYVASDGNHYPVGGNGWYVNSCDGANIIVTAPPNAPIDTGYYVHSRAGSNTRTTAAYFAVTAPSNLLPQGGTATFPGNPNVEYGDLRSGWDIQSSTGAFVAADYAPNGWRVTAPDNGATMTVSAPSNAQAGNGYYVEIYAPTLAHSSTAAANFAVTAPASSYLYVSYLGGTTVDMVDPVTFKIVKTISGINASNGTYGIAESVDGTKVYTGRGTLYALDSLSGNVLASVSVPVYGLSLAVSPDGKRVYGANGYGGYAVYDASSLSVLHSQVSTYGDIDIGQTLIAVSPDNTLFAVCNFYGSGVSIYRTNDYTLVANVPVPSALGCVFSKDSHSLFVTEYSYSKVAVISTGTGAVTKVLPVGVGPEDIAISTDGGKVFVVNDNNSFLSVIDTATLTVTNSGTTGYGGDSIAYSVDGQHLYTAVSGLLLEIDPITLQITRQLAVNGTVEGLTTAVPH